MMLEVLVRMYALMLFVAYRVVIPRNARDMAFLKEHREHLEDLGRLGREFEESDTDEVTSYDGEVTPVDINGEVLD